MKNLTSILKTAGILFVIGFVCTLILTVCNYVTKDIIAQNAIKEENAAKKEVLTLATDFSEISVEDENIDAVYEGVADGKTVGYCVKVSPLGYGGEISMMVGVGVDGKVSGVKIVDMSETPGLGARAKEPSFINAYSGKKDGIKVIKSGIPEDDEVSAISGATITSKAVTEGVNSALSAVSSLRKEGAK